MLAEDHALTGPGRGRAPDHLGWSFPALEAMPVATHPVKRGFDIVAAGLGLLLFLPLLALVFALIRLESPGPAIFRQRRTGYRGRVFTIYKFRTMTVTEDEGAIVQATKGDNRVTAIGAL